MSYDYTILKMVPVPATPAEIDHPDKLLSMGSSREIYAKLSALYPEMRWKTTSANSSEDIKKDLYGSIPPESGMRLEISFEDEANKVIWISIYTSFRQDVSHEIKKIATALDAFYWDMQTGEIWHASRDSTG